MDSQTFLMFIKIIVFLPFIIFLIYLFIKYGGTKLHDIQSGKYIKVMERVSLSKENSLIIVKIGEKAYVFSSSQGSTEIIMELSDEDIAKIESHNSIKEYGSIKEMIKTFKSKKEDNNE